MAFTFQFLIISSSLVLLSLTSLFGSCNARTVGLTMKVFEEWMSEHGRVYANAEEMQRRYGIFKDNVKYIEEFNKVGGRSYTLGITQFTDLTNKEFVDTYATGAVMEEIPTTTETSMSDFEYENLTLRTAVDRRTEGAVTGVKNQLTCGSCWAFAAVAAVEGIYKKKIGVRKSLSEQEVLDCSGGGDCTAGHLYKAFDFVIANKGLTTEANYPYKGSKGVCDKTKLPGHAAYITGYRSAPQNNEAELMKAVNNQPVAVGVNAKPWQHYTGGIFNDACEPTITHFVVIDGYGEESGKKYWIIKNSWGTKWGESGYMRIAKDVAAKEGLCGVATYSLYPYIGIERQY